MRQALLLDRRQWLAASAASVAAPSLLRAAEPQVTTAEQGAVACVIPAAADVGLDILRRGGTAVDAAVAVAMALAVTYPRAGNIGGGGFMMVHPGPGQWPVCVDYRETAPAASTVGMFGPDSSGVGHKTVGTPGTVAGLALAHDQFGRLAWNDLVMPAVRLAREGFAIDPSEAELLNQYLADSPEFAEFRRVYGKPGGGDWQGGDKLVLPELAATLELIAKDGPRAFYEGAIAAKLVAEMKAGGGIIAQKDLAAYRAKMRRPIFGTYRGYEVFGPPPPSSGGITLVQMLNMLETFPLADHGRFSAWTLHRMVESMRRAYRNRARWLCDADFVDIPTHLTSKEFARRLAAGIHPERATPSEEIAGDIRLAPEGDSTTHFSIVDRRGMCVANTFTLERNYGARVVVRGAGFLLNNEMGDFNWLPGVTNRQGRIGTKANLIAPGKRMLSSQCPTLVARHGRPVLATGSPGGRTIINTVLNILVSVIDFEMPLADAIAAPRIHHSWFPDRVHFEGAGDAQYAAAVKELRTMGHEIEDAIAGFQGDAHSIQLTGDGLVAVADQRISGKAAGY